MQLNIKKCKYIVIVPPRKEVPHLNLQLDDCELASCTTIKSLGIIIDRNAKWTDHISDVCKRANFRISTLQPLIKQISLTNDKLVFSTYVLSLLIYCAMIWGSASKNDMNNINKCVRRCAEFYFKN